MTQTPDPLLSTCELAATLARSLGYVKAMKRNGFRMPGGRARLSDALRWLEANPPPCRRLLSNADQR
jgi:hypothetical protein